jgi:diguanylate cyclase (GGDEF)-like protein
MSPAFIRQFVVHATVFTVYLGLGTLGLSLGGLDAGTSAVWPQSGFAIALLVVLGRRYWPAVLAGAFFVHFTTSGMFIGSLAVGLGNTWADVVAALLIERLAAGHQAFQAPKNIFRFTTIVFGCAAIISATVGATVVTLSGGGAWADYGYHWMSWSLGNLTGGLVVTPFVVLWATGTIKRPTWSEAFEATALFALLIAIGLIVFGGLFPSDIKNYPLEFLCVPVFLWSAFRFGRRSAATATVILSGLAVWGTLAGFGPFVRETRNESLVLLQAYISVMALMGLVLSAAMAEQRRAEEQLLELAITDSLTGLANYRRLLEVLRTEIARSNRTGRPFSVLFLDMNGLKRINDKYGHLVGSRAISRVADTLRRSCRTIDTPSRFGGDEFALVLPETPETGALVVLKRVMDRLAADKDRPALSVCGGVAEFPRDGDNPTLLMRAADQALYKAKEQAAARRAAAATDEPRRTGTLF